MIGISYNASGFYVNYSADDIDIFPFLDKPRQLLMDKKNHHADIAKIKRLEIKHEKKYRKVIRKRRS